MAYVITRLCRDCKDMGCVSICPADCILEHSPASAASTLPNQLFIDPDECIDCHACVAECPWEAIYPDADVPAELEPDVTLNAIIRTRRHEFRPPEIHPAPTPDADAVRENKNRWGLAQSR